MNQIKTRTLIIPATTAESKAINLKSWLAMGLLSLIWGTSFILIKKGLAVYEPVQVASLRLGISAIAFTPVLLYNWSRVNWTKWRWMLAVGLSGSALPAILYSVAQTEVSSSVAGILNSLTPLFTLVLGILFFHSTLVWRKVLGVVLGLIGAASLIILGRSAGLEGNLWYGLLIIVATVCYGTSVNVVGAHLKDMSSPLISATAFMMVGIPALGYLFTTNFTQLLFHEPGAWKALGYISILALAGTVFATILFFQVVKWTTPLFSSMVAYLMPVVALGWGLLDGEPVGVIHLLGMGLILAGVYLSRR